MKTPFPLPTIIKRIPLLLILITSLLFSISLLAIRIWYVNNIDYLFLVWNLFLAFIPFALSSMLVLYEKNIKLLALLLILALWLLFFPNAPYILTDLFHWQEKDPVPPWYDLIVILSFSWNGLMLGFISLADVQKVLTKRCNSFFSWAFVVLVIFLSSFGIYLGRYLRWNSWDIFTNPWGLKDDIVERILSPIVYLEVWAMTIVFAIFLLLGYLLIKHFPTFTDNI